VASAGYQDTAGVEYVVVHDLTRDPTRKPPPDPELAWQLGVESEPIFSRLWSYPNVILEPCFLGRLEGTLAVSADSRLLAGGAAEWSDGGDVPEELWVWDVGTGAYRRTAVPARPDALAFSPDSRWLFGARSGGLDRWDVETLSRRTWRRRDGRIGALRFSPDGAVLAAGTAGAVVLLDVRDLEAPAVEGRLLPAVDLAFHPEGRLLTAGGDGVVRVWDPASGRELVALDWSAGPLHSLAVAPGGMTAAVGGENGQIVVWDVDG
jgi:WD40 repeat protein